MKRTILFLAIMVVSAGTFAKDNFKFSGRIDGVTTDTLLVEFTEFTPQKKNHNYKVPVKDGQFFFSTRLHEAVEAKLCLKTSSRDEILTFFVPDEEAVFNSHFDYIQQRWSGSAFYQKYQQICVVATYETNMTAPEIRAKDRVSFSTCTSCSPISLWAKNCHANSHTTLRIE